MKLEIDTNDRAKLQQLEAELSKALAVVRFAINGQIQSRADESSAEAENEGSDSDTTLTQLTEVIKNLPSRFTSAAVRTAAGNLTRSAVNAGLMRIEQRGIIRTVQRGVGRRPATFEKVAQT